MDEKSLEFRYLKPSQLKRGDFVIVQCAKEEDMEMTGQWAQQMFQGLGVRLGVCTKDLEIKILRNPEEEVTKVSKLKKK